MLSATTAGMILALGVNRTRTFLAYRRVAFSLESAGFNAKGRFEGDQLYASTGAPERCGGIITTEFQIAR